MKIVARTLVIIASLAAALLVMQSLASERVEVVELHTQDAEGTPMITRLWVVDDEGYAYLRGNSNSGWLTRLKENGTFDVTRGTETGRYGFVLRVDKAEHINALMADKYTWGDEFFAVMLGGREDSIPVELHPVGD